MITQLEEAARQALEVLKQDRAWLESDAPKLVWDKNNEAITALRAALEQPADEPSGPLVEGWAITFGDGHAGYGVYAHMEEYPEEGAFLILPVEQPAQDEHKNNCALLQIPSKDCDCQPAQDEPVAWMHTMDNTEGHKANKPYVVFTKSKRNPFGVAGRDYSKSYPVTKQPLYTRPQAREPLTDEQIQYAFRTNSVVVDNGNAYMVAGKRAVNITRAIEAAHGIGEKT